MNLRRILLFVLAISFAKFPTISAAQWKNFRGNSENTGQSTLKGTQFYEAKNGQEIEVFSTGKLIYATAVTDFEGNYYLGSTDKFFYSFNIHGEFRWKTKIYDKDDALIDSAAAIVPGNLVIVPGGDGFLHALDLDTGKRKWDFKAHHVPDNEHSEGAIVNSFEGNVTFFKDTIYAGSDNGHLYALDLEGKEKWSLKTGMMIWSSPCFSNSGHWMAFGSLDRKLYLVDSRSGRVFDTRKMNGEIKASPVCDSKRQAIFVGSSAGEISMFKVFPFRDSFRMRKGFTFKTDGEIYSSAAYDGTNLYFGSLDGSFYAIDTMNNGELLWKFNAYSPMVSSPFLTSDGIILFGAKNSKIYALKARGGHRIFSLKLGESELSANIDASPILNSDGFVVVGSYDRNIYRFPLSFCFQSENMLAARRSNEGGRFSCEFHGLEDVPEFGGDIKANQGNLRFVNKRGTLTNTLSELGPYDILTIKLIAFEKGKYIPNAAINPLNIKISADNPDADFKVVVASDGSYANIIPLSPWPSGETITLRIDSEYYHSEGFFIDRFKYLFLPNFGGNLRFSTKTRESAQSAYSELSSQKVSPMIVHSMLLYQPASLDTYIPAALEAQAFFLQLIPKEDPSKFIALVSPATQTAEGLKVLPSPQKVFFLEGETNGKNFGMRGEFELSAMGGTIPFSDSFFSGSFGDDALGQAYLVAGCRKLKGNGMAFNFSWNLINRTCDHRLNVIAVGRFSSSTENLAKERSFDLLELSKEPQKIRIKVLSSLKTKVLATLIGFKDGLAERKKKSFVWELDEGENTFVIRGEEAGDFYHYPLNYLQVDQEVLHFAMQSVIVSVD